MRFRMDEQGDMNMTYGFPPPGARANDSELFQLKNVDATPEEIVRLSADGVLTVNLRALGWRPPEN